MLFRSNHTSVWREILKTNLGFPLYIKIVRGGPVRRTNVSPVEDWIPHDIFLLAELFKEKLFNLKIDHTEFGQDRLFANLCIPDHKIYVDMDVGYFPEGKVAFWELCFSGLSQKIDFISNKITNLQTDIETSILQNDAITDFFYFTLNEDSSAISLKFEIQELFARNLLKMS